MVLQFSNSQKDRNYSSIDYPTATDWKKSALSHFAGGYR